jgi:hypothetical protein
VTILLLIAAIIACALVSVGIGALTTVLVRMRRRMLARRGIR